MAGLPRAKVGKYRQKSIRKRLEAFFLDNVGKVASSAQIEEVARDPETGKVPARWHQRISELRTDFGYSILTNRDRKDLKVSEYMLVSAQRRKEAGRRVKIDPETWKEVLERADNRCEWEEGGTRCGLKIGDTDPIGGGTVRLTPDHKTPHQMNPESDPKDANAWQALCGRHQVEKKNYWDHTTGKVNVYAIVQAAPVHVKRDVYDLLKKFFND
jgi:hypothetical protein